MAERNYLGDGHEAQAEHAKDEERLARTLPKNQTATAPNAPGHVPLVVQQARDEIARRVGSRVAIETGLHQQANPSQVTIPEPRNEVARKPHPDGGSIVIYDDGSREHEWLGFNPATERYDQYLREPMSPIHMPDDD